MGRWAAAIALLCSALSVCRAQYGTAENGYYPTGYHGTIFTGAVTSANDETREVELTFKDPKNGKTQTFAGVLQAGYSIKLKDGSIHELKLSEIRPGARIKVYYLPSTKKVDGKKTRVNIIFLIGGSPNVQAQHSNFMAIQ